MKIILASSSPRRKAIIDNFIDNLEIIIPSIIEETLPGESPLEFSQRISKEKAESIMQNQKKNINSSRDRT